MVLVLGVSAGAGGARAILTHSDQPHQNPIDTCHVSGDPDTDVGASVDDAISTIRAAAAQRGELISATAISYRSDTHADSVRTAVTNRENVRLVDEATAQLRYLRFIGRLPKSGTVVLYDLGSSGLTITLADCETARVLRTRRTTVLGGDEHDGLLRRRLAHRGISTDLSTTRQLKENLCAERVLTVQDSSTGNRSVVTRSDMDELLNAGITHSASIVRQMIDETRLEPQSIILLGGSVRNPLIEHWLAMNINLPVDTEPEPELVAARGAVLLAGDREARVVRTIRAIGAAAPEAKATSRRKLIAALAVTGILAATVGGLILTNNHSEQSTDGGTKPTPVEVAGTSTDPFR